MKNTNNKKGNFNGAGAFATGLAAIILYMPTQATSVSKTVSNYDPGSVVKSSFTYNSDTTKANSDLALAKIAYASKTQNPNLKFSYVLLPVQGFSNDSINKYESILANSLKTNVSNIGVAVVDTSDVYDAKTANTLRNAGFNVSPTGINYQPGISKKAIYAGKKGSFTINGQYLGSGKDTKVAGNYFTQNANGNFSRKMRIQ